MKLFFFLFSDKPSSIEPGDCNFEKVLKVILKTELLEIKGAILICVEETLSDGSCVSDYW